MSTNDGKSQESTECPTCGKEFDTERSVKLHHAAAHGESIAYETTSCDECGTEFDRKPAKLKEYDNHFCSRDCQNRWLSDKEQVICDNCGAAFERTPSNIYDRNFCSTECRSEWMSEELTGEDAPRWDGGKLESVCDRCEESFKHRRHQPGRFCSNECFHAHLSENAKDDTPYYGASWTSQRQRALDRDGRTCVICGDDGTVDVHHIHPFRKFGVENHEDANRLENLVTLCRNHHMKWEGIPLRPEVV